MPYIPTVPTLSQFSASVLSNHSVFYISYPSLYKAISCALTVPTPSRQSGSIRLYSPVRLLISLSFDFICSDTHILRTSLSVSYKYVSERTFAHRRTITFFSISVTVPLPLSAHFKCTFRVHICLFCPLLSLRLLYYRLNLFLTKITL